MSGLATQAVCSLLKKPQPSVQPIQMAEKMKLQSAEEAPGLRARKQLLCLSVFISKERSIDLITSNIPSLILKVTT